MIQILGVLMKLMPGGYNAKFSWGNGHKYALGRQDVNIMSKLVHILNINRNKEIQR